MSIDLPVTHVFDPEFRQEYILAAGNAPRIVDDKFFLATPTGPSEPIALSVIVKGFTTDGLLSLKEHVDAELKFRMLPADKKLDGAEAP